MNNTLQEKADDTTRIHSQVWSFLALLCPLFITMFAACCNFSWITLSHNSPPPQDNVIVSLETCFTTLHQSCFNLVAPLKWKYFPPSQYTSLTVSIPILNSTVSNGGKTLTLRPGQFEQQHSDSEMEHPSYALQCLAPPETGISSFLLWQFTLLQSVGQLTSQAPRPVWGPPALLMVVVWIQNSTTQRNSLNKFDFKWYNSIYQLLLASYVVVHMMQCMIFFAWHFCVSNVSMKHFLKQISC